MEPEGTYFLLYDGECRICTAFARAVAALDIRGTLRARPLQDSRDLLGGMPEEEILGAAHVVAPDGPVTTGAAAMPTIAGVLLGVPRLEAWLRSSPPRMRAVSRAYDFLVSLRGQLTCGVPSPSSAARSPR